jgi:tetrapyrrole methylase family protein/MazG family protein
MPSPPKFTFERPADLSSLWELIKALRGENGCPWDKKQTPETLKKYLLEETYEVLSALSEGNLEELREEFGDLLFILLFIIYLFEERGDFTLRDVSLSKLSEDD